MIPRTSPDRTLSTPLAARIPRQRNPPGAGMVEPVAILPFDVDHFRGELHSWYSAHARALPWRGIRNAYATWLSEIMLQQTRVATVIERYNEFLRRFPSLESLAEAKEEDVLALWSGLGYYRRAHLLHRAAQFVQREFGGKLPRTAQALRTLPGVGEYTAAAIASIAFGEPVAVVDGNVERVLLRLLGRAENRSGSARGSLNRVAQALVPPAAKRKDRSNPPGDHNQAMMELGATICLPRQPLCLECPVFAVCRTRGEHPTVARDKPQSRIVAHLLVLRKRGTSTETLLLRRPAHAPLMPKMLELPPLPLETVEGREPVLRLRHSITNTNYYVQIFAESAPGVAPVRLAVAGEEEGDTMDAVAHGLLGASQVDGQAPSEFLAVAANAVPDHVRDLVSLPATRPSAAARAAKNYGDELYVPDSDDIPGLNLDTRLTAPEGALLAQVPAAEADLEWTATNRLALLPLTGLTRKVLQRLGVMSLPRLHLS